jgi:MtN3 and saliva related transmembrane protein
MDAWAAMGYVGGCVLAAQHVPQIAKVWTTRSARDLSLTFLGFNVLGLSTMLAYAASSRDTPFVVSLTASLVLSVALAASKLHLDRAHAHAPPAPPPQPEAPAL